MTPAAIHRHREWIEWVCGNATSVEKGLSDTKHSVTGRVVHRTLIGETCKHN